jgi:hypothetical protein
VKALRYVQDILDITCHHLDFHVQVCHNTRSIGNLKRYLGKLPRSPIECQMGQIPGIGVAGTKGMAR